MTKGIIKAQDIVFKNVNSNSIFVFKSFCKNEDKSDYIANINQTL